MATVNRNSIWVLQLSGIRSDQPLHVATKVRVQLTTQTDLRPLVVASVKESLSRLNLPRVTLLQIHNSITLNRLDQPTSITPEDVLGRAGCWLACRKSEPRAGLISSG